MRVVKVMRRFMPVTDDYEGTRFTVVQKGARALTPFALVTVAVLATDIVFAVDSVPAVYGITGDPYLVFVTNAFALLGLRALYFVLEGALGALRAPQLRPGRDPGLHRRQAGAALGPPGLAVCPRRADADLAVRDPRHPRRHDRHEPVGQQARRRAATDDEQETVGTR